MIYFEIGGRGDAWHCGFEEFQSSPLQKVFRQNTVGKKRKRKKKEEEELHIKSKEEKKKIVQCEFQNDSHPVPPSST